MNENLQKLADLLAYYKCEALSKEPLHHDLLITSELSSPVKGYTHVVRAANTHQPEKPAFDDFEGVMVSLGVAVGSEPSKDPECFSAYLAKPDECSLSFDTEVLEPGEGKPEELDKRYKELGETYVIRTFVPN